MKRPEVEKYEAMAEATRGCRVAAQGDVDAIAWLTGAVRITDDLCRYIHDLESILRDWLAACPETCGQCEVVRKRAEEAVR